ncbi:MAG: hypothetical protein ACE5I7_13165 [Candidatus Binatia bacterium]
MAVRGLPRVHAIARHGRGQGSALPDASGCHVLCPEYPSGAMTPRATASVVLVTILLAPGLLQARWNGVEDSKSPAELEAMSTDELFHEGFDVCVSRALLQGPLDKTGQPTNPPPAAAGAYLDRIGHVASERNGGTVPAWMKELAAAHTAKRCQHAFRLFLEAKVPKKRPAPEPKHGSRATQLPPWLAPR